MMKEIHTTKPKQTLEATLLMITQYCISEDPWNWYPALKAETTLNKETVTKNTQSGEFAGKVANRFVKTEATISRPESLRL